MTAIEFQFHKHKTKARLFGELDDSRYRAGKKKIKMSLKHLVGPESKEVLKDQKGGGGCQRLTRTNLNELPVAKAGTIGEAQ